MPLAPRPKPLLLADRTERKQTEKPRNCLRTECMVSALLIGLLAMFVTWGSSAIVKAGYELVQARACLTKLEKDNELLRLEMAKLKSHQRIQEIAVKQLGMIKPQTVYIAAKESKPARENKNEQVATRGTILFGNGRAEAHQAQPVASR